MQRKFIGFFLGILSFLIIILFTDLEPGKPEVTATLAVAALILVAVRNWGLYQTGGNS